LKKWETDVLIIGSGITGASIARELSQYKVNVTVAEKSPDTFTGQTKMGHGLVYSGRSLNMAFSLVLKSIMAPDVPLWEPDTLKIKLAAEGYKLFEPLAKRLEVPYKPTKFLMIARNDDELKSLKKMVEIADLMGIRDTMKWLSREDALDLEPNLTKDIVAAVYEDKGTKTTFPPEYDLANVENARDNGVNFLYGAEAKAIKPLDGGFITETARGSISSRFIVNAAGIYANVVADMAGARDDWDLVHNRSQMVLLDKRLKNMFKSITCIHVATPPGHFQAMQIQVHGNPYLFCGQFYPTTDKSGTQTKREWFKENIELARELMPSLSSKDVITSFTGIRTFNTRNVEDHIMEFSKRRPGFLNAAIRLPGFSVAPAAAKYIVDLLGNGGLPLVEKTDYNPYRKAIPIFSDLSDAEKEKLISQDPRYGHVICRCETVTEGEIVEAIRRGARTVQGVQFRTRAGMGRCQRGFCQRGFCSPRIVEILARELGIPETEVTFKGPGSEILKYRSKELLVRS
jgi:glycerol-3-phosphate dehydrogenase